MTTYQIVDTAVAPHANLLTLTRDTEAEAIARMSGLQAWFDPAPKYQERSSVAAYRWRDKVNGHEMQAYRTAMPALSTINGQPSLSFGADGLPDLTEGRGSLAAVGNALDVDGGSYTYAFLGEGLTGAGGAILGSDLATESFMINLESTGSLLRVYHRQGQSITLSGQATQGVRFVAVASFDGTATARLRMNGTLLATKTDALPPHPGRLLIGARAGRDGTTSATLLKATRLGHVLMFDTDLTAPGRSADLARVETYLRGLAGV